jgi:molybdopterin-binding protein
MMKSTLRRRLEVTVPRVVRRTVIPAVDPETGDGLAGAIVATAVVDARDPRVGDRVAAEAKATSLCSQRH